MPVVAQGCKLKPQRGSLPEADINDVVRDYTMIQDDEPDERPSEFEDAIKKVQETRAKQTANTAEFLAANAEKHKLAGKNIKIGAIKGYITDKGLFKRWNNNNLMVEAGKYGCPNPSTFDPATGYTLPNNSKSTAGQYGQDYGAYVGAPMKKAESSDPKDTIFLGTRLGPRNWNMTSNDDPAMIKMIPACGTEGSNVHVVYPAKATGSAYKGSYKSDKMEYQADIRRGGGQVGATYETCKIRAEDKGSSVFGISNDRCYLGLDKNIDEVQKAGLAYEFVSTKLSDNQAAHLFYFGKDGSLSLLASTNVASLYKTTKHTETHNSGGICDKTKNVPGTNKTCSAWGYVDTKNQRANGLPASVNPVYPNNHCWNGSQCSDTPSPDVLTYTYTYYYSLNALKSFGIVAGREEKGGSGKGGMRRYMGSGIPECNLFTGGVLAENPKGTYGGNCNAIIRAQPRVSLFQHCGFGGKNVNLVAGDYNMHDIGLGNDSISSVKVPPTLKLTLYEHSNFHGNEITINSDISCLIDLGWNDMASSLKIRLI